MLLRLNNKGSCFQRSKNPQYQKSENPKNPNLQKSKNSNFQKSNNSKKTKFQKSKKSLTYNSKFQKPKQPNIQTLESFVFQALCKPLSETGVLYSPLGGSRHSVKSWVAQLIHMHSKPKWLSLFAILVSLLLREDQEAREISHTFVVLVPFASFEFCYAHANGIMDQIESISVHLFIHNVAS